jgi:hypothetical protein
LLLVLLNSFCQSTVSGQEVVQSPDAPTPSLSASIYDTSQRAFNAKLVELWEKDRFAELDATADRVRKERLRFKGGAWCLHVLYATLSFPGSSTATDAEWQAHIEKLQRWIASAPDSSTPRAALAQTYLRFAWKARGNGYASTVTPEGAALFKQRVQLARDVLDDAAKRGIRDPGTYRQMQTVALAQGWDRHAFDALTEEALASEPGYYYFAIAEANYLLPKWYGQAGDTERYAAQVADQRGDTEAAEVYFRIAAALNCCKRTQAPALSWPRIQEGFARIQQLYGSTNGQRNALAYLAIGAGDTATARKLFTLIGDDWDANVWKTKARYEAARAGQFTTEAVPDFDLSE